MKELTNEDRFNQFLDNWNNANISKVLKNAVENFKYHERGDWIETALTDTYKLKYTKASIDYQPQYKKFTSLYIYADSLSEIKLGRLCKLERLLKNMFEDVGL